MSLGMEVGLAPRHIVLDGDPAPSRPERGTSAPTFRHMSVVAKRSPISVTSELFFFMVALWNRADHIYFHAVVCSFFLLFFLA